MFRGLPPAPVEGANWRADLSQSPTSSLSLPSFGAGREASGSKSNKGRLSALLSPVKNQMSSRGVY